MLTMALARQKEKKMIVQGLIFFGFFMLIYTILDNLNGGYALMREDFGLGLVILNIFTNIIMSLMSAFMMNLSTALFVFTKKEGKGTILSAFAVIFGIFTYGCTPCVIAFLAAFGITFSVLVLPLAGYPYKLLSVLILVLGTLWLMHELSRSQCEVKDE